MIQMKGFLFVFYTLFLLSSCASNEAFLKLESRVRIQEKRIAELEVEKKDFVEDFETTTDNVEENWRKQVKSFRKLYKNFYGDLEKFRSDLEQIERKIEKQENTQTNFAKTLLRLEKKIGDLILFYEQWEKLLILSSIKGDIKKESDKLYWSAFRFMKQKEFEAAEKNFLLYRKDFSKEQYIQDTLFYLGYIHLLNKKYEDSILYFYELLDGYSDVQNPDEVRWWLAVALDRAKKISAAEKVLGQLASKGKKASWRKKASIRLKELKQTVKK